MHEHAPDEHVCPAPQAFPQIPQFALSVSTFTQPDAAHDTSPPSQLHPPETHVRPVGHIVVHVPQWLGEVRSTSHPVLAVPSQSPNPVAHPVGPMTHAPLTQETVLALT